MPGVSIADGFVASASVNCEKYSSTPQYCGGSSNRASATSRPGGGNSVMLDSSKYFESTATPQRAQRASRATLPNGIVMVDLAAGADGAQSTTDGG